MAMHILVLKSMMNKFNKILLSSMRMNKVRPAAESQDLIAETDRIVIYLLRLKDPYLV